MPGGGAERRIKDEFIVLIHEIRPPGVLGKPLAVVPKIVSCQEREDNQIGRVLHRTMPRRLKLLRGPVTA